MSYLPSKTSKTDIKCVPLTSMSPVVCHCCNGEITLTHKTPITTAANAIFKENKLTFYEVSRTNFLTQKKQTNKHTSRKHAYSYNFDPLKSHFYIIFLISVEKKIDYMHGYSLELPHWGGSNKYPQSMFWAEIRKLMFTPVNPSFTI